MAGQTTLYRHFDKRGRLLYVGVSHDALKRANDHFRDKSWAKDVARFDVQHFPSRDLALAAEKTAIIAELPLHNIAGMPLQRELKLRAPAKPRAQRKAAGPAVELDLARHMQELERDVLVAALERHRGNRTAAGLHIGLSLRQMRYRMEKLGITAK